MYCMFVSVQYVNSIHNVECHLLIVISTYCDKSIFFTDLIEQFDVQYDLVFYDFRLYFSGPTVRAYIYSNKGQCSATQLMNL